MSINNVKICGVLNITPDSFYPGSRTAPSDAAKKAADLVSLGADLIDVGAVSTAPGVSLAGEREEMNRLSVLADIRKAVDVPVSVDTFRVSAAEFAIDIGADIINDTSGSLDPAMAELIASSGKSWIIMHTGGLSSSQTQDYSHGIIYELSSFFHRAVELAGRFGITNDRLILDPGIGFGKSRRNDLDIIRNYDKIDFAGCASMAALSRKRVTKLAGDALIGSLVFNCACVLKGAEYIRTHDVSETLSAVNQLRLLKGDVIID